jgi:uncharacterized repeat protein (TIGR01451 family)
VTLDQNRNAVVLSKYEVDMKKNITLETIFLGIIFLVVCSDISLAVGTPAGTVIQSRSRVVYSTASGTVSDTVYSNYVNFTVAQVGGVNSTPSTNASTTNSDSVYAAYPLTITNSGNGADQFTLSSTSSKGWTRDFYFDSNGDGVLQGSEVTAGAITQTAANIAADATYKILVRVFVPRDASLNGQTDTTVVTVASVFNSLQKTTALVRTTVNTAYFANAGTGLSVLPTNPNPGDNVTYTFTLTNSGSVSATGVTFSDLFNSSQFTFVSANTTQGTINTSGNPIIWNAGTINPAGSITISIVLNVNSLPNGAVLNNTIGVTYTVGGQTFTVTSNNPSAAVGVVRGWSVAPVSLSSTKEIEDTIVYAIRVKNTGNSKDIGELSYSSSKSFSWTFYKDVNANGLLDGGDTQLTDAVGSTTGVDVDSVAANDSVKVLARSIVPEIATDGDQDITTFTIKSGADPSKFQNAVATSTINVANVAVTRTVSPLGNQPPGQEMEFSVTYQNNGNGKAYNVVFTENEPDSMSYVVNSTTINDVVKTDVADADEVTVTTVSGRKLITVSVGILNGLSAPGIIKFRAVIH